MTNGFLILILLVELIILGALALVLFFQRKMNRLSEKKIAAYRATLSQGIADCLRQKKKDFSGFESVLSKEVLLSVMEAYDRRLKDEGWEELKKSISNLYLLPYARKWFKSFFWKRRNFSARCFALSPRCEDEQRILSLIDDAVFLVRSHVAAAIARLGIKKGIEKILIHMAKDAGYSHFFYRDILLQEQTSLVFTPIQEIATEKRDHPSMHLACLDLLASKVMTLSYPFLKNDLESTSEKIRLAAVKVYSRNPQKDSVEVLLKCIDDLNDEVRAEAAHGLGYFLSRKSIEKLENALTDKAWIVRLQAAWSLKRMGGTGLAILEKQNPQINKQAFDTAQYALQFDW